MATVHDKWKRQMAGQGQETFEEMGISFEGAVAEDPTWWDRVNKLRYSGTQMRDAFQLGVESALFDKEEQTEQFETFVERLAGVKRAKKHERENRKARRERKA